MRRPEQRDTIIRRGAAAVEMALVAPFLVLIVFGSIDVGQFVNTSQTVSNASREGARKASRADTLTVLEVELTVQDYLDKSAAISPSAVRVAVVDGGGASIQGGDLTRIPSGEPVSVQVTIEFNSIRWIRFFGPLNRACNSTTTVMRRE